VRVPLCKESTLNEDHGLSHKTRASELSQVAGIISRQGRQWETWNKYLGQEPGYFLRQPLDQPQVNMVGLKLIAVAAFSSLVLAVPQISNKGDWKSKIKNVVILVEENRSFDTFAGGLSYSGDIDGLLHHNYCNSMYDPPSNQ